MLIREYDRSDWDAIARIHDAARRDELRDSAGPDAFLTLAQTAEGEGLFDGRLWVAEIDHAVRGFVALDGDEITWLYVDPAHYRRGIGRALLRHALGHTGDRAEVTVLDGNPAALALYRSEGFVVRETRTGPLVGNERFTATGHIMERRPSITRTGTREVYRNPWMTVREDTVRHPDGTPGIYGVVERPDFALVLPRWAEGFWLVEQYRYPVRRRAWEFPQGSWGHGGGGTAAELARAELAEETGLRAGTLTHLGHLFEAYGYSTQGFDVYLATGLVPGEPDREPGEQDMVHRRFTDAEVDDLIRGGLMVDGASLAALTLHRLGHSPG